LNNFGDVIKQLLEIVFEGLPKKDAEIYKNNLKRYLRNESTSSTKNNGSKTIKAIIPCSRIAGRRPLVKVASEILEELEVKLKFANEFERIKNEQASSLTGLFGPTNEHHKDGSATNYRTFIPADQMIHIPQKTEPNLIQTIYEILGTPIQKCMRDAGHLKSRLSKAELNSAFRSKLGASASLSDELFNLKIIDKREFDQISLLFLQLQIAYKEICKRNKEVINNDIIDAYKYLEEAGFLSPKQCKELKNKSLREIIICEYPGCKNTFTKKRKTHKFCDEHSNSSQYRKHIRNRHKEQQN